MQQCSLDEHLFAEETPRPMGRSTRRGRLREEVDLWTSSMPKLAAASERYEPGAA